MQCFCEPGAGSNVQWRVGDWKDRLRHRAKVYHVVDVQHNDSDKVVIWFTDYD